MALISRLILPRNRGEVLQNMRVHPEHVNKQYCYRYSIPNLILKHRTKARTKYFAIDEDDPRITRTA